MTSTPESNNTSPAHEIFYDVSRLSHAEQEALLRKAHSLSDRWHFDKLDCSESYARQKIDGIPFEDAMTHFIGKAHMVVILRQKVLKFEDPHLEVGFRSMEDPVDYFLWIVVPLKHLQEITNGLTPIQ